MSINSVSSSSSQNISSLLLQQLLAGESATQNSSDSSGILGDLVSFSSGAKQLAQTPEAVTQAMTDLFSGQTDVQGDVTQLKSYFKQNPQSLVSVLSSLQGGSGTYTSSGSLASLLSGTSSNSQTQAQTLMSSLLQTQVQDPLLASLGSSDSSSTFSLLG